MPAGTRPPPHRTRGHGGDQSAIEVSAYELPFEVADDDNHADAMEYEEQGGGGGDDEEEEEELEGKLPGDCLASTFVYLAMIIQLTY